MQSRSSRSVLSRLGLLGLAVIVPAGLPRAGEPVPAMAPLTVGDEAGKLKPCPPRAWQGLPRRTVEVKEEGRTARYEGVPLHEVLRFAGVPFGKHPRGERIAAYVLVEAADGYRAVLALAEVDPALTDKVVLLADRRDGKALAEASGPYRLIVAQDKLRSRWVKRVSRITIHRPAPARQKPQADHRRQRESRPGLNCHCCGRSVAAHAGGANGAFALSYILLSDRAGKLLRPTFAETQVIAVHGTCDFAPSPQTPPIAAVCTAFRGAFNALRDS